MNKPTNYTDGKWEVVKRKGDTTKITSKIFDTIDGKNYGELNITVAYIPWENTGMGQSNANLISAAPAMFHALEALLYAINTDADQEEAMEKAKNALEIAIGK